MAENNIPIQIEVRPPSRSDVDGVVRTFAEIKQRVEAQGRDIGKGQKYAVFNKSDLDVGLNNFKQYANSIVSIQRQMERDLAKQDIFKAAGIRSPQAIQNELNYLNQAKQLWMDAGKSTEGYRGALEQIDRRINTITTGNARARGELHRFTAALASLSFELTGAVYGISVLAGFIAGPAIVGGKFLASLETTQLGLAGILTTMAKIDGQAVSFNKAMNVSAEVINELGKAAIRTGNSTLELTKTFQAILAPGLASGMNLKEIQQIAVVGGAAVKAIGLEPKQMVQEIRDLVAGGIQPASSTLATSLGLKDSDIKAARESAEGLFAFLMNKLRGFSDMADETSKTFSGKLTILGEVVNRTFAMSFQGAFSSSKAAIDKIINYFGEIDRKTGEFKPNERLLETLKQWDRLLSSIVDLLGFAIEKITEFSNTKIELPFGKAANELQVMTYGIGLATIAMKGFGSATKEASLLVKSLSGALAFMLGYDIGSWANESFDWVRKLGVGIVTAFVTGTEVIKVFVGGATVLLTAFVQNITASITSVPAAIKAAFGAVVGGLASLLDKLGLGGKASEVMSKFAMDMGGDYSKVTDDIIKRNQLVKDSMNSMWSEAKKNISNAASGWDRTSESVDAVSKKTKELSDLEKIRNGDNALILKAIEERARKTRTFAEEEQSAQIKVAMATRDKLKSEIESGKFSGDSLKEQEKNLKRFDEAIKLIQKDLDVKESKRGARKLQVEENTIEKLTNQQKDLNFHVGQYVQGVKDSIEEREFELSLAGKRSDEVDVLRAHHAIQKEINKVTNDYTMLLTRIQQSDALSATQKKILTDIIEKEKQANIDAIKEVERAQVDSIKKTFDTQTSAAFGAKEAWNEYANGGTTAAEQIKKAFTGVFQATEDALVEFVKTGKISFGSLVDSMLNDLIRMAAHQATKSFFDIIGSSMGGSGGSSNFFGNIGSAIMSIFSANGNAFDSAGHISKFANGGAFTNSIVSQPTMFAFANGGAFGMMGEAGPEAILPLTRTPGGDLGVRSTGGGNVQVNVAVNMETGATSTTTQGGQDMSQLGDIIGNKVKSVILEEQRPGGLLNRSR